MHECAPPWGGAFVPNHFFGYTHPQDGQGFIGMVAYSSIQNGAEYGQVQLIEPCKAFNKYKLSMWFSLADYSDYTIDNFGALVSKPIISTGTCLPFTETPQLLASFLRDTMNWVYYETEFIAAGGEEWLTIGRFDYKGPPILQVVVPDTNPWYPQLHAYYLVDNVSLVNITGPEYLPEFPNIFTPNNDGSNDVFLCPYFDHLSNEQLQIYNRWGKEMANIIEPQTGWDGKTKNGQNAPDGVYYYVYSAVIIESNKQAQVTGTVQLVR